MLQRMAMWLPDLDEIAIEDRYAMLEDETEEPYGDPLLDFYTEFGDDADDRDDEENEPC